MKHVFTVLIIFSLFGCAAPPPKPMPVTAARISGFQKGVTTEAEVLALLGKPLSSIVNMDGSRIISYAAVDTGIRGASYIPVVGMFAGGADMKINSATFTFDATGRLFNYLISDTAYSVNSMGQRQPQRE
jgi:hypothetical protein